MAEVQTLRKGDIFEEESNLWRVLEFQHIKMARGSATIRLKVRNVRTGSTVDRTYNNGERVNDVELDRDDVQYLYKDEDFYHFMNTSTFEQFAVEPELLEGVTDYLVDEMIVTMESHEGEPLTFQLPASVDLKVIWAENAVSGDTAGVSTKQIELETGYKLQVPMFVQQGDVVRINTREGAYITRVKQ